MPKRIQRQRTKGWRMPENALYVGRPTAFGNPFPVDIYGRQGAVDLFRRWLRREMSAEERSHTSRYPENLAAAWHRLTVRGLELRGKDLACWCPLEDADGNPVACHADVLLEWANREEQGE